MKNKQGRAILMLSFGLLLASGTAVVAGNWPTAGGNLANTRSAVEAKISTHNVHQLHVQWEYLTTPDSGTTTAAIGSVSATPAVAGNTVYFTDWAGNIHAVAKKTGSLIWKKNFLTDISAPGMTLNYSTNTPAVAGNKLLVGNNYFIGAPLCAPNTIPTQALGCVTGDGAIVVALDRKNGNVLWRTKVDAHPAAKVTGSVSVHGGTVYVPVASWEEEWSRSHTDPTDPAKPYSCCSFRGSLVALDVRTGAMKWKTYLSVGKDTEGLPEELKQLLGEKGFFGVSTYGHSPAIDVRRKQVYIATAQTYTAPEAAVKCEEARRMTGRADANIDGLPEGVTCNTLNEKLKTFGNAMLALDTQTGAIKWAYFARKYDAWVHSCDAPDFGIGGIFPPILFATPRSNVANCPKLPGPDYGFGGQPMLLRNVSTAKGVRRDLVIAGNKDGRVFALNADNGQLIWEAKADPGSIYGGIQFGMASDGKRIYTGTTNAHNTNRDIHAPFVSEKMFLTANNLADLIPYVGGHHTQDGASAEDRPAPGPFLPFPAPDMTEYPGVPHPMTTPTSGPKEKWTLVHPPSDIAADGLNVVQEGGGLRTIAGMITALDARTGAIVWQRPAIEATTPATGQGPTGVHGTVTVANGIVYAGYADGKGTMVALDAATGKKLFEFHAQIKVNGVPTNSGMLEGGPAVVDSAVYWGVGAGTLGPFSPANPGNRVYAFALPTPRRHCLEAKHLPTEHSQIRRRFRKCFDPIESIKEGETAWNSETD